MRIIWRSYSIPKLGNSIVENEDAIWPAWVERKTQSRYYFSCAMSDGATQASFSAVWANLLVRAVGKLRNKITYSKLKHAIEGAQYKWKRTIENYQLPWYAEEKAKQGSYATFLRLDLWGDERHGIWQVIGIGDTCFFHVRAHKLIKSFPIEQSHAFNNSPPLISSLPEKNAWIWNKNRIQSCKGSWQRGDHFFIMTDALAAWFLKNSESNADLPTLLIEAGLEKSSKNGLFDYWVQSLIKNGLIHNDDTSLIWLTIP